MKIKNSDMSCFKHPAQEKIKHKFKKKKKQRRKF